MRRLHVLALVLTAAMLPCSAFSGDGDKPEAKKDVVKKEESKAENKGEKKGNCFTRFWVHTVGSNMAGGLKTGARKIERAFD
jgi:hypothetical protein